jgi:hypothetical protein
MKQRGELSVIFPTHIVAVSGLIRNHDNKILLMKHPKRAYVQKGGSIR